jgi:hypothetical protein
LLSKLAPSIRLTSMTEPKRPDLQNNAHELGNPSC